MFLCHSSVLGLPFGPSEDSECRFFLLFLLLHSTTDWRETHSGGTFRASIIGRLPSDIIAMRAYRPGVLQVGHTPVTYSRISSDSSVYYLFIHWVTDGVFT